MEKDEEKYKEMGGWGWELFSDNSKSGSLKDAKSECFGCHRPEERNDFVFSEWTE